MSNIQKQFETSLSIFAKKEPTLPSKIRWKLNLIVDMIRGGYPRKQLLTLEQQMQFEDLESLDQVNLKLLFNNIIQTLFVDTTELKNKGSIKKSGFFSGWVDADVTIDQKFLVLSYSKKKRQYKLQDCELKKCKKNAKTLELLYEGNHQYSIKFKEKQMMQEIIRAWQQKKIQLKCHSNYLEMTSLMEQQTQMGQISLFQKCGYPQMPLKKAHSLHKKRPHLVSQQRVMSPQAVVKPERVNKNKLNPLPHGYSCRLFSDTLLLGVGEKQAKIYVEMFFSGEVQIKKLLTVLLLQKSWNKFIIYERIQKAAEMGNKIQIDRKYDTQKEVGAFLALDFHITYTSLDKDSCMLSGESLSTEENSPRIASKWIISVKSKDGFPKLIIEEELTSSIVETPALKQLLYKMYKDLAKLDIIFDQLLIKDFEAQTVVENLFEEEDSTNTQDHESEDNKVLSKYVSLSRHVVDRVADEQNNQQTFSKQAATELKETVPVADRKETVHLQSPLQIPSPQFIRLIRQKAFEKNYFFNRFSEKVQSIYDDYVPPYRLDQMIKRKEYEIIPSRELRFIDQELLDSQKDVLKFVLRQIGANLISGKSILNVSLPVDIFQPRTGLERGAASYASFPDYLLPCAQADLITQTKNVTGFIITALTSQLVMKKPFNPILGETFQGYIKGIPIYYQQISHSPPVSSYFLSCPQCKIYGTLVPYADVGLNTGIGGNAGAMYVQFANGNKFQCYFPPSEIAGLIYGDRKFRCYNKGYILNRKESIFVEFSMQNQKKGVYESEKKLKVGELIGGIFKVKPQLFEELDKFKKTYKSLKKFGGISKNQVVEKIAPIEGQWFSEIYIGGQVINKYIKLYPVEYSKNLLPSDSNFRLDVLYLKMQNVSQSQKQKQYLESLQRNDRKLREQYQRKSAN